MMWPASARYLATIANTRTQYIRLDVLHNGDRVATMDGLNLANDDSGLSVSNISGKITVGRNTIRRSATLDFVDAGGQFTPDDVHDLFAYFNCEIRPWVGVQYWDATIAEKTAQSAFEWIPLGTFVVTDAQVTYPQLTLTGYDRMWLLGMFAQSFAVVKGTTLDAALIALLAQQVPGTKFQFDISPSEYVTSDLLYTENTDSAQAAHDIAAAGGLILYVDPMGVFKTDVEASTTDQLDFEYLPGTSAIHMRPKRQIAASQMYNTVVFTTSSTNINPPLRSVAQDTDPRSLSNVFVAGVRPYFEASPLIQTQPQLDHAALTRLRSIVGIPDTLTVPVFPNYLHEPNDVIHVVDDDQNINKVVIVDSFDLGLRASDGAQELVCRSNVLV